jgi:hypothetical protein
MDHGYVEQLVSSCDTMQQALNGRRTKDIVLLQSPVCCRFVCNYIYHKSLQLTHSLSCSQQDAAAGGSSGSSSSSSCLAAESPDKQEDAALAAAGASSDAGSSDGGSTSVAQRHQQVDACAVTPCYSLFVHVPSFEAVPEDKQQQFLLALLNSISKRLDTPTVT